MGIQYSEEQLKAIETLDRSILVSAAAGSGKTAVLVARILNIILEGKANVDEMLVVTFTNAAASEMKLRLSKEIRKRIREHPEEAPRLKEQLGRLYKAYISTIHSFAKRVIKEFFYETDSEPNVSICDDIQGELMRREAVAELFEAGFDDDNFIGSEVGFREFLRLYSAERSEDAAKEDLINAYESLRAMPDYFGWAYRQAEELNISKENLESTALFRMMRSDTADTLSKVIGIYDNIRSLMEEAGVGKLFEDKLVPELNSVLFAYNAVTNGRLDDEIMDLIGNINYVTLKAPKDLKESYEPIKDEVAGLRKQYKKELGDWRSKYLVPDLETRIREMNAAYKYTVYYIRLLEEFERIYQSKKAERHVMDFSDMEHNAVKILSNDTAAETLQKRFKFVFVDEYQDTNKIQEYLISKVSRPDNVFKVGDVKQSIYKFRQAEPELFEQLYKEYSDPSNQTGIAIDLSRNYRSNEATIRYINRVFEHIMEGYDDRAKLKTDRHLDPMYDFIPEIHILTDEDEKETQEQEEDEEITDLSKQEAEAAYIADLAYGLIGTEFYDTKANVVRKAQARDIVILYRAVKMKGDIVARALRKKGIETHVEESDDYFDAVEIAVALSLLTCIDNIRRDIPLISSLHSEVFGWTPEELAQVRIDHAEYLRSPDASRTTGIRPAYWEALIWYCTYGPDIRLKEKANHAVSKIMEWRRLSRMMALEDFIWMVLTDSGYYRMAGAMNGGARRQANLRTLADRAGKYSSETVSSLSSYISFLDVMRSKKISNGQVSMVGSDDDVIRILTIHKSKGLEYPFVIVGGLGTAFKTDSSQKKFTFDSSVGVSMPYVDPDRRFWRSTLMQRAIISKSRQDDYKEELRVLYVAMTRARNKLIMVGTCKTIEKLMEYSSRPANYLKVLNQFIHTPDNRCYISPLARKSSDREHAQAASPKDRIPDTLTAQEAGLYDEINRRFTYRYPDTELLQAKAKYSVSAIRREELSNAAAMDHPEEEQGIKVPDHEVVALWNASESHKKASAADIGIAYHRIMEFMDFKKVLKADGTVDADYIRDSAETLRDNNAIADEVYESLDLQRIAEFFTGDLGLRTVEAAKNGKLKKEKPFTLKTERNGNEILVQGVIDCCFEENGRMILIDYKSSFIRPDKRFEEELTRIKHEYRIQIDLYSEAVVKGTGLEVQEAYLYLFAAGEAVRMI